MVHILRFTSLFKTMLDIETGKAFYHKMFLQFVTLTLTLYTFYLDGKVLHMMEGFFLMHKAIKGFLRL